MFDSTPTPITLAERGRHSDQMAEAMARAIAGRRRCLGSCERHNLVADGFTAEEVAAFYDRAEELARNLSAVVAIAVSGALVHLVSLAVGAGA